MKKTVILSALTACVILGSVQITEAAKAPQFITKYYTAYQSFCGSVQQKPEAKPPVQKPESSIPEADTNASSYASEVLRLVNVERAKNGLQALTLDSSLSAVAKKHSEDMAAKNYFSHTNLSGQSPFDRLKSAGISYKTAGENIAAGQKSPSQVVTGWMNSEGHRKNILNKSFTKMGLGYAESNSGYGTYWTQLFIG